MNLSELQGKRVIIWGLGKEGVAAERLLRAQKIDYSLAFVDEKPTATLPKELGSYRLYTTEDQIAEALAQSDVVIKSPGVSLYHPLLNKFSEKGGIITSLLNLWMATLKNTIVIAVTGTKGKSTASSLLAHVLCEMGHAISLVGNIGTPVTECNPEQTEYCIVEVSSYQAALFQGSCDLALVTSLYPEHLNWHVSLSQYYADKCRLLLHCEKSIVTKQASDVLLDEKIEIEPDIIVNHSQHFHVEGDLVLYADKAVGKIVNEFLLREHNHGNLCLVLAAIDVLGLNVREAIDAFVSYRGLPHRQHELGEMAGVLYVDDSISTTPQSAIAAMKHYKNRLLTLIAGGQDRGVDYAGFVDYLIENKVQIVLIGETGHKIAFMLSDRGHVQHKVADGMAQAVALAKDVTPRGGVILLSPGAPSFDMFVDYVERAKVFAKQAGFIH